MKVASRKTDAFVIDVLRFAKDEAGGMTAKTQFFAHRRPTTERE